MTTIAKIITETGIGLYLEGQAPFTMARDNKHFDALLEAVKEKDIEKILSIIDIASRAHQYMKGKVTVEGGEVFYEGEEVHGVIVDRIVEFMANDEDAESLLSFLENLMLNPSSKSRRDLYNFLEAAQMPITEDGRFIAYKWVREDGLDCHSGTNYHAVGNIIEMPRHKVDDDSNQTCSTGLHVCSPGYSKFGPRLFLVAVNPADVVAVPYDYKNSKMRVCKYEVIAEVEQDEYQTFNSGLYRNGEDNFEREADEDHGNYYNED